MTDKFIQFAGDQQLEISRTERLNDHSLFLFEGKEDEIPGITRKLINCNIDILKIAKHEKSLEEIFVELTGKHKTDNVSDRF